MVFFVRRSKLRCLEGDFVDLHINAGDTDSAEALAFALVRNIHGV